MKTLLSTIPFLFIVSAYPAFAQTNSEETETAVITFEVSDPVRTASSSHCIKADPAPCSIEIEASLNTCSFAAYAEITMQVSTSYNQFGRQDIDQISHRWTGRECSVTLLWPLTNGALGGSYQITANFRLTDGQTGIERRSGILTGENPTTDAVRTHVSNPTYSVLLYLRNGFQHFNPNGRPRIADGFGAGGLHMPNAGELWNWTLNVDAAVAEFDAAFATASAYPEQLRQAGFVGLPDFTPDQRKLHALQSMVGEPYYFPARDGSGWTPLADRASFADDVIKIEADVAAGNPPADW